MSLSQVRTARQEIFQNVPGHVAADTASVLSSPRRRQRDVTVATRSRNNSISFQKNESRRPQITSIRF